MAGHWQRPRQIAESLARLSGLRNDLNGDFRFSAVVGFVLPGGCGRQETRPVAAGHAHGRMTRTNLRSEMEILLGQGTADLFGKARNRDRKGAVSVLTKP